MGQIARLFKTSLLWNFQQPYFLIQFHTLIQYYLQYRTLGHGSNFGENDKSTAHTSVLSRDQGVTRRCRLYLSWPIAPLIYEPKCGAGGGGVSANENSCVHHVTWSPNKLRRSNYIFNLWQRRRIRGKSNIRSLFTFLYWKEWAFLSGV